MHDGHSTVEPVEKVTEGFIVALRDTRQYDSKHDGVVGKNVGSGCSDAVAEGPDALVDQENLDARLLELSDGVA